MKSYFRNLEIKGCIARKLVAERTRPQAVTSNVSPDVSFASGRIGVRIRCEARQYTCRDESNSKHNIIIKLKYAKPNLPQRLPGKRACSRNRAE